jgi:hypothetical protein
VESKSKFCYTIFFLTLLFSFLSAQEVRYGLSLGYSNTSVTFSHEHKTDNPNAEDNYNLRALVEIQPHPRFSFESGLKFFKSSYNMDVDYRAIIGPSPRFISTSLSYLSIPLNVNYYLPFLSTVYISAGMEGAFLISATTFVRYDDNSDIHIDESDRYKNFSRLFSVSFGIEHKFGNVILFLEPEYTKSFYEVSKNPTWVIDYFIESINLNIGLKF